MVALRAKSSPEPLGGEPDPLSTTATTGPVAAAETATRPKTNHICSIAGDERMPARLLLTGVAAMILAGTVACADAGGVPALPDFSQIASYAVESGARTWQRANDLPGGLSSRELFAYALALCEADQHMDRLDRLFEVAARMQDRDQESRGYGNFRWSWEDGAVLDYNAVEFCMQSAVVIWIRHRDAIPASARNTLRELLDYACEGCMRHRVPSSYTNIALMNAQNLILLGEVLDKPEIARTGYERLDQFCIYTWQWGIHEFCSPTYYGTDLDCLVLLEAFCRREETREKARALLELFWTDLALNWHPESERLAGARSRDYDYLRGTGYLDVQMWANGWLQGDIRGGTSLLHPALAKWRPPQGLYDMNQSRFPRYVRQSWGIGRSHGRAHMMFRDVTLSASGANYGAMDMPLTVDLPGPRDSVRCYFIPDARRDPYGKKRIPAGPHEKTLHLRPLFAAAQRRTDALGLVVYRDSDLPDNPATLESHFVMPKAVDELWIGDEGIDPNQATGTFELEPGQAACVRKGTAVAGVRVPWARALDGRPAPAAVVFDGNDHGAMRLTVAHHSFWGVEDKTTNAGAAFWVRIGSDIAGPEAFAQWRADFSRASADADVTADTIGVQADGIDGPLKVVTARPFRGCLQMEPPHTTAVLELDGESIGRAILEDLEPIRSYEEHIQQAPVIEVLAGEATRWEAERGAVEGQMAVDTDDEAFGSRYVWTPGEVGGKGSRSGAVTWRLNVAKAGTYYLWGRLIAPTPDDDSFFVRVLTQQGSLIDHAAWHTGTHEQWEWAAVSLDRTGQPAKLMLPAGEVTLQLRTREDGTKIDQLYITPKDNDRPT